MKCNSSNKAVIKDEISQVLESQETLKKGLKSLESEEKLLNLEQDTVTVDFNQVEERFGAD